MSVRTQTNQITEGVIWKQLLLFFFPILLGTFFQQLYNTVDAIIVGQFLGTASLAAVGGPTGTLINVVVNLFVGVATGTTVVVAQQFGAEQHEQVRKTVHTALSLSVWGGLLLTALGALLAVPMLRLMGTPEDVLAPAAVYLRTYFFGVVPSFIYNIGSGILRAVGDTRRPLYFLIAGCLVNIVLDIFFVAVVGLGVLGAALATVLSQTVSAVLTLYVLVHGTRPCRVVPSQALRPDGRCVRAILRVGVPAGLQSNMYGISNILVQSCINSFGTVTVASWTAFSKVDGFFWMIVGAYGMAVTTFVGQNVGAARLDRVRKSVRQCLAMAGGTALGMSALVCCFAPQLLRLFTPNPDVLALGTQMVLHNTPFYITYVSVEILSGAIRGSGDALAPMLLTGGGICVFRIVWLFAVLPFHRTIFMLIASYPASWVLTSTLFIVYYLRGTWLKKCPRLAGAANL